MTLSVEQRRFLALHRRALVVRWSWLFRGGTLSAETEQGERVTITGAGFAGMVDAGLVELIGSAGVRVTNRGWEIAA